MTTTATQPYTVPVLASDLRRAELVKQFADTFDYLDAISHDMFNRIAIRLNVYRAQLNKFNERIQHANAHIDRIKGSKRAIQVHSSARYPVEQNRSTYKSIFQSENDTDEQKPPVLRYSSFRLNETVDKFLDPNDKGSKSNDESFIVLKQYENNSMQKTKKNVVMGLGKAPANIKSVVSFLKYNTQENPYTQPTKIDPLSVGRSKPKQMDEPTQRRISETPAPDFYKHISERPTVDNLKYNPILGLVPELDLPANLELDNFATFDDNATIGWTKQEMSSIAPSLIGLVLPDIIDLSSTPTPAPIVEPVKATVPAPPPVDIPAIIPLMTAPTSVPPQAPPPPAPAPLLPSALPSVLSDPPADDSQASIDNQESESGNPLLDAIRNFKTDKLKSTKKSDPFDEAPPQPVKGEENIMDTLKRRLQQRRALIAGEDPSSSAVKKPAPAAPTPPPSTGGAFTDAIASKAQEIKNEQQRRNNDSDADSDDNDDEWEN